MGPAMGPVFANASQPRFLIQVVTSLLAFLVLPYWRITSAPAISSGAVYRDNLRLVGITGF
jgi:hypothetical protein